MTASVQDGWPLFRERQRPGLRAWLVLLPLLAGLFLGSAAGADERVQVKRVYDGDTVLLQDGRKVRYLGINAPEFQEPYYLKAKRFNESLVLQRQIRLEYDREPVDAYDRLLAYVYADDRMVNAALLEQGLAHAFFIGPSRRHDRLFLQLQAEARRRRLGMWSVRGWAKDLKITGVHLPDAQRPDPHAAYVRIANLGNTVVHLTGYQLASEGGQRYRFPDVPLPPGYTVIVDGTPGPDGPDERGQMIVHWPEQRTAWDPREDTAFLLNPAGAVVDTFHYKGRRITRPPHPSREAGP